MRMKTLTVLMTVLATGTVFTTVQHQALAMEHAHTMGQGSREATAQDQTPGATWSRGVIQAVNVEAGSVNITHEPIPALSWPTMTMDLPVTEAVDLSGVKAGDTVEFAIVLGSDDVYRISQMRKTD
jgi:Cu(I)/Ag(I) efflux system periplasmic protein CusF